MDSYLDMTCHNVTGQLLLRRDSSLATSRYRGNIDHMGFSKSDHFLLGLQFHILLQHRTLAASKRPLKRNMDREMFLSILDFCNVIIYLKKMSF
jgi:hypothetical protein